jgi:hypothetical protein
MPRHTSSSLTVVGVDLRPQTVSLVVVERTNRRVHVTRAETLERSSLEPQALAAQFAGCEVVAAITERVGVAPLIVPPAFPKSRYTEHAEVEAEELVPGTKAAERVVQVVRGESGTYIVAADKRAIASREEELRDLGVRPNRLDISAFAWLRICPTGVIDDLGGAPLVALQAGRGPYAVNFADDSDPWAFANHAKSVIGRLKSEQEIVQLNLAYAGTRADRFEALRRVLADDGVVVTPLLIAGRAKRWPFAYALATWAYEHIASQGVAA